MAGGSADVLAVAVERRHGQRSGVPPARRPDVRPPQPVPRERGRRHASPTCSGGSRSSTTPGRSAIPSAGDRAARRSRTGSCWRASSASSGASRSRCALPSAARSGGWSELAANATPQLALAHDELMSQRTRARRIEALEELREALNLESLPVRIECFDISNLGEHESRRLDGGVRGRRRRSAPTTASSASRHDGRAGRLRDRCTRRSRRRFARMTTVDDGRLRPQLRRLPRTWS